MPEQFPGSPIAGIDSVFFDLDGVVYRGKDAIPGAVESLNVLSQIRKLGYITNNASRSGSDVAEHLRSLGIDCEPDQVVTSVQAAGELLQTMVPAPATVLIVGSPALESEIRSRGYTTTRTDTPEVTAVVQGYHPDVAWRDLAEAAYAVGRGTVWIATNTDWTMPQERGIAPGNGTLVSAVHTAAGPLATVAGKPEFPIFETATQRFHSQASLMIGDRLDTDILGGNRAGMKTVLVLTGIDQPKQVVAAPDDYQPTYILNNLTELFQPYPEIVHSEHKGNPTVTVRDASVMIRDRDYIDVLSVGEDRTDLLRAACALIWPTKRAIYGFYVPPEIFNYRVI